MLMQFNTTTCFEHPFYISDALWVIVIFMSHKPELMICANDLGVLAAISLNSVGECKNKQDWYLLTWK